MARTKRQRPRKRLKKKDYLTYGAALNGPVTTTRFDGTTTTTPAATREELHKIIRKGKKRQATKNKIKETRQRLKALQQ